MSSRTGQNAVLFAGLGLGVIAIFIAVFVDQNSWGLDWGTMQGWYIYLIPFILIIGIAVWGLPKMNKGGGII